VAFDDEGNVVVVWSGPRPDGCNSGGLWRIYGRRFQWSPGPPAVLQAVSEPFIVNNNSQWDDFNPADSNPTVSLTTDSENPGRFVVCWNTAHPTDTHTEVRGQFFDADGLPRGPEFTLTQLPNPDLPQQHVVDRRIAESGQHTLAYRSDDSVAATWTASDSQGAVDQVYFTLLPPGFADAICSSATCLKGDCNDDELVNGLDVQPFVDALLGGLPGGLCTFQLRVDEAALCPFDLNGDGTLTVADIPCFVERLIFGDDSCETFCDGGGIGTPRPGDRNGNGIADAHDIASGFSVDCDANRIPDECQIDENSTAPGGPWYCTEDCDGDLNNDGDPDACDPDCDDDGQPDDYEIVQGADDCNGNSVPDACERDCNGNGVPDDCDVDPTDPDGNTLVSDDCNENGLPDECEEDCNNNDVPDDCDIDPSDPDGNGQVSADCQPNGIPDSCDLSRSVLASFDCNENAVPDECDIASSYSQDANSNGIPDECEGEGFMGGGSVPQGFGGDEAAAWEAFWAWYADVLANGVGGTAWAELTHGQQFDAIMAKITEVGLPYARPW
jgi:hypothetical protein